ncbi:MAG: hypothetical protein QXG54_05405 [Desulfurococcaceae archaeon]
MEAFELMKVKVESTMECLNGEYTLVEPHDPRDQFLAFVLSKRFSQLESLLRTAPKNLLRKLVSVYFVERVTISEYATLERIHIYLWQTNTGSKVYIIPPDLVFFKTQSGNKYIVKIDLFKFLSSLPPD